MKTEFFNSLLGVIFWRVFRSQFIEQDSLAEFAAEHFWALWLVMPLVIGCMAVAEERRLGVQEGQFCLPVSRRRQFIVKFIPAMFFGVFFGGVMPLLLEGLGALLGVPNPSLTGSSLPGYYYVSGFNLFLICISVGAAGLALMGFFASTLARNFLQALSIAIVGIVLLVFCARYLFVGMNLEQAQLLRAGAQWWGAILPVPVGLLTFAVFIPWLAWRNFSRFVESGRLWRRNLLGILGAVVFVLASSAVIYQRGWEIFEPAEPPHGPAKFSLANPPELQSNGQDSLRVRLPDGRVWFDSVGSVSMRELTSWERLRQAMIPPLPTSDGPGQFMGGSNWISTTMNQRINFWRNGNWVTGYPDTVGIQPNGSLWISSESRPVVWTGAKMIPFGDETDWRQVISVYGRLLLLLKTDGTLWQMGSIHYAWNQWQTNWPTFRHLQPERLGTDSDWQEIFSSFTGFAQKTDGSVWRLDLATNAVQFLRQTNMDQIVPQTFSQSLGGPNSYVRSAYIAKDGTLRIRNLFLGNAAQAGPLVGAAYLRVGTEVNWRAVAMDWHRMVALKTDGSLWQWRLTAKTTAEAIKIPPTPFSIHRDWVGLANVWGGVISLAADGSLWFWPGDEYNQGTLLRAPKQPKRLANVFDQPD